MLNHRIEGGLRGTTLVLIHPLGGDLTQNGRIDEWVDLEDHLRAVEAAAAIVATWCGLGAVRA